MISPPMTRGRRRMRRHAAIPVTIVWECVRGKAGEGRTRGVGSVRWRATGCTGMQKEREESRRLIRSVEGEVWVCGIPGEGRRGGSNIDDVLPSLFYRSVRLRLAPPPPFPCTTRVPQAINRWSFGILVLVQVCGPCTTCSTTSPPKCHVLPRSIERWGCLTALVCLSTLPSIATSLSSYHLPLLVAVTKAGCHALKDPGHGVRCEDALRRGCEV